MDRSAFREKLHESLQKTLFSSLKELSDQRHEELQQFLRYISALDRKYESSGIINEGLPSILSSIKKKMLSEEQNCLSSQYFTAVDELASEFPEETQWQQQEERFQVQDEDPISVSVGKRIKSAGRSVAVLTHKSKQQLAKLGGKQAKAVSPETQTVPLRAVLQVELIDEDVARKCIRSLENRLLELITRIEDFLVQNCFATLKNDEQLDLPAFVDRLEEQIEKQREEYDKLIESEVQKLEGKVLRKVEKAGTFEYPNRLLTEQRVATQKDRIGTRLDQIEQKWFDTQKLLFGRTENASVFLQVFEDLNIQCRKFLSDFESDFKSKLEEPLQKLLNMLSDAGDHFDKDFSAEKVADLQEQLSQHLEEELAAPLQNMANQQVLSRKVEHFMENLLLIANQVPEQTLLVYNEKLEENPPSVDKRSMEWRLLVVRAIREQIMSGIQADSQQYDVFVAELMQDVAEIRNVIAANLETAQAAFDEDAEQEVEHPKKVLREGLQRLQAKVEELRKNIADQWEKVEQTVTAGRQQFSESMLGMIHEGDVQELQLLNAKYKVKKTTKDWRTALDSKLARALDRLAIWRRFSWKRGKKWWQGIRIWLGLQEQKMEEVKRADIASYLSETDQKMRELPYIYRRLFNFDEVADQRFYVSPVEGSATFRKAYDQWKQSSSATLAVVGEKGSGKSTFLNQATANISTDEEIVTIDMHQTVWKESELISIIAEKLGHPEAQTADELIASIRQAENSRVVVMERVQNCFVRNINGYEAIEKLCYLISETKDDLFWMVSSSLYAWRLLDKIIQLNEYFSHVVRTDSLDADQIESIIMNRHRASGYALHFEPSSSIESTRLYRKLRDNDEEAQKYLKEKYFEKLTELAEGNASIAMIFWIRSIKEFDDSYFYIRPLEVPSLEMIEDLSPQVLFALAAVILHDSISDEDLSMILNLTKEESRLLLKRLHSRGLLVESEEIYGINQLMYRQIVRVLKERNIIHLV